MASDNRRRDGVKVPVCRGALVLTLTVALWAATCDASSNLISHGQKVTTTNATTTTTKEQIPQNANFIKALRQDAFYARINTLFAKFQTGNIGEDVLVNAIMSLVESLMKQHHISSKLRIMAFAVAVDYAASKVVMEFYPYIINHIHKLLPEHFAPIDLTIFESSTYFDLLKCLKTNAGNGLTDGSGIMRGDIKFHVGTPQHIIGYLISTAVNPAETESALPKGDEWLAGCKKQMYWLAFKHDNAFDEHIGTLATMLSPKLNDDVLKYFTNDDYQKYCFSLMNEEMMRLMLEIMKTEDTEEKKRDSVVLKILKSKSFITPEPSWVSLSRVSETMQAFRNEGYEFFLVDGVKPRLDQFKLDVEALDAIKEHPARGQLIKNIVTAIQQLQERETKMVLQKILAKETIKINEFTEETFPPNFAQYSLPLLFANNNKLSMFVQHIFNNTSKHENIFLNFSDPTQIFSSLMLSKKMIEWTATPASGEPEGKHEGDGPESGEPEGKPEGGEPEGKPEGGEPAGDEPKAEEPKTPENDGEAKRDGETGSPDTEPTKEEPDDGTGSIPSNPPTPGGSGPPGPQIDSATHERMQSALFKIVTMYIQQTAELKTIMLRMYGYETVLGFLQQIENEFNKAKNVPLGVKTTFFNFLELINIESYLYLNASDSKPELNYKRIARTGLRELIAPETATKSWLHATNLTFYQQQLPNKKFAINIVKEVNKGPSVDTITYGWNASADDELKYHALRVVDKDYVLSLYYFYANLNGILKAPIPGDDAGKQVLLGNIRPLFKAILATNKACEKVNKKSMHTLTLLNKVIKVQTSIAQKLPQDLKTEFEDVIKSTQGRISDR